MYNKVHEGTVRVCIFTAFLLYFYFTASEVNEALSLISVGTGTPFVIKDSLDLIFL